MTPNSPVAAKGLSLRIEELEELSRPGRPMYVVYQSEGVRLASDVEVELWQDNERLREATEVEQLRAELKKCGDDARAVLRDALDEIERLKDLLLVALKSEPYIGGEWGDATRTALGLAGSSYTPTEERNEWS